MSTIFTKSIEPINGNWILTIGIASKDPADVTLAETFGDLRLDFRGQQFVDPSDNTFSFTIPKDDEVRGAIYRNILLNKLPNAQFIYLFDDASVLAATRYRQCVIFANAVQAAITAALVALRALPAITTVNTTFTA